MHSGRRINKGLGIIAVFLFVVTGTYNAVVINSESSISAEDVRFVKRLDEVYGVVTPGRMVAASTSWKKLKKEEVKTNPIVQVVKKLDAAPAVVAKQQEEAPAVTEAAVQEELELNLVEVINPKKWKQGLPTTEFTGNLSTNSGMIESLSVSLPNGEGISVSFSEMSGNVFEYDMEGEIFSGMLYQVDQSSYMVTLSNGPLEGTRLRFSKPASDEYSQDPQVAAGNFGQEPQQQVAFQPDEISQYDQAVQAQAGQSSFNLEQQTY